MHAIVNFERAEVPPFCREHGLATRPPFLTITRDVSSRSSAEKRIKKKKTQNSEVQSY